jgi:transcriptional regulator with XRE-family HTH domain
MTKIIHLSAIISQMKTEFTTWLNGELQARGWSQSELARRGSINSSSINRVLNGERKPGLEVCRGIAQAFGISIYEVMRRAGIEQRVPIESEEVAQMLKDFYQLPKRDRDCIRDQIRALRILRDQQAEHELNKGK